LAVPVPELLDAVAEIPGVNGASFDAEEAGLLRVDLHADAAAETVHRAVDALLLERFGLPGQAQRLEETTGTLSADDDRLRVGRLAVDRLVVRADDDATSVTVRLSLDGRSAPGAAEDDGAADASRAIVSALLLALEELTEDAVIATIEDLDFVDGGETVNVRLRLDVDGSEIVASGSASVLTHSPQAVARAALSAVEPHLPR
jgi:hypothetical protein